MSERSDAEAHIMNSAVEDAFEKIGKRHPLFKDRATYMAKHLDHKNLKLKMGELYHKATTLGAQSQNDIFKYIHHGLVDYISSGNAFDNQGKEVIFMKSLEEKAKDSKGPIKFFSSRRAKKELSEEQSLENKIYSFGALYDAFSDPESAKFFPEAAQAAASLKASNSMYAAMRVLKYIGRLTSEEYEKYLGLLNEGLDSGANTVRETVKKYFAPQQQNYENAQAVAASVVGFSGLMMVLLSGTKVTGNVIGTLSNTHTGIIGATLIIIALILFSKLRKKKIARRNKRKIN